MTNYPRILITGSKWPVITPLSPRTYLNISQSSIEPRETYLAALVQLRQQLSDTLDIIDGRNTIDRPQVHLEMPVETILRKYVEFTQKLRSATENNQSFSLYFNDLLDRIIMIRTELSQTILRCSMGDANFKEIEHQLKILEPELETVIDQHLRDKKALLAEFTEQLVQKVELDISVRQAIQDRHVMHATLQTYLKHIEANSDFNQLLPTIQFKLKQIVTRPLDQVLSEQQHEVDIAKHELNQLLEPLQNNGMVDVPESAASVHQLLQQGVNQTEELNRLKVNVMGAFKHLVTQMDQLFQFQPLPPVQAASVLGAAWMQHPLTSSESIREFKGQLDAIKQSESYVKLTQYVGEGRVDESFRYVDKKMDEMAEHLAMNERFQTISEPQELPILMHANEVSLQPQHIDPLKARRELLSRNSYLKNIKGYIQQLSQSVKAHLMLVYYEHSLNPEKVNLAARTQAVLNQISKEFYERKNTDEAIDKAVFMSAVKDVFEDICDYELEKNQDVFEVRLKIKGLLKSFKQTNPLARKTIRKKLALERKELKKRLIAVNAPRLKGFIDTLSNDVYANIHTESVDQMAELKDKLRAMVQEKLAMEQVRVL